MEITTISCVTAILILSLSETAVGHPVEPNSIYHRLFPGPLGITLLERPTRISARKPEHARELQLGGQLVEGTPQRQPYTKFLTQRGRCERRCPRLAEPTVGNSTGLPEGAGIRGVHGRTVVRDALHSVVPSLAPVRSEG